MAQAGNTYINALSDNLTCPICMCIYNNPSTLPCGHSFCFECISASEDSKCPLCRRRFIFSSVIRAFGIQDLCDVFYQQRMLSPTCTLCTEGRKAMGSCNRCYHALCTECTEGFCGEEYDDEEDALQHEVVVREENSETSKVYYCPIHESQQADRVCLICQQSTCKVCDRESMHSRHESQVINREDLPQHLSSKIEEIRVALIPIQRIEESINKKYATLNGQAANIIEDIDAAYSQLQEKLLKIIDESRSAILERLERMCRAQFQDAIKSQLARITQFEETFNAFGKLAISYDNCVTVLRKQSDMELLLNKIEKNLDLLGISRLEYKPPEFKPVVEILESTLRASLQDFQVATKDSMMQFPVSSASLKLPNSAYCVGSPSIRIVSNLENDDEFSELGSWQIAMKDGSIYLASKKSSKNGLWKIDIMTGIISDCQYRNNSFMSFRRRGDAGKLVGDPNSVLLGRELDGSTYVCIARFQQAEIPGAGAGAAVILAINRNNQLSSRQVLRAKDPIAVCFGSENCIYFIERETKDLFVYELRGSTEKARRICTAECKATKVMMSFDQQNSKVWIRTSYSELTEVDRTGKMVTWEMKGSTLINGFAVDCNGLLWVADSGSAKVLVYRQTATGPSLVGEIRGNLHRTFHLPSSVAIDNDLLAVMDKGENGTYSFFVYKGVQTFQSR